MVGQLRIVNFIFLVILAVFMIFVFTLLKSECDLKPIEFHSRVVKKFEKDIYFMDSNNITGYPYFVVPNIVHYVLFGVRQIQFGHYMSLLSVLKNQNPDIIFIHCDCDQLYGHYYKKVMARVRQTKTVFEVRRIPKPNEIFGKAISQEFNDWHSSDITRLRVLSELGGIFVDNDVFLVQSLDVFRKYEMTISWNDNSLNSEVIVSHRNARFLHRWIDSYHNYDPSLKYYNSIDVPKNTILDKHQELVHRVDTQFAITPTDVCPKIYSYYYLNWRQDFFAIDMLLSNDQVEIKQRNWCLNDLKNKLVHLNETIVLKMNVTFGEMYRSLFT